MQNHTIREIDVPTKTARIYIENELVIAFPYNPDNPKRSVFDQIVSGSKPIHIVDWQKFPTKGMVYSNGEFFDGSNGETFFEYPSNDPLCFVGQGAEAIATVSSENIVDGIIILQIHMGDFVVDLWEGMFAALMSDPIIILDNFVVDPHALTTQSIGQTIEIAIWPDDFEYVSN